jgi:hypothetical protein
MYGLGANYNTMEHKFRAWRKTAETLRATEGEGIPMRQAQTTPRKPRNPTTGGRKTSSGSKKKSANSSKVVDPVDTDEPTDEPEASEEIPNFVDLSNDDASPMDARIKLENDLTRDLLGVKSYTGSDDDAELKFEDVEEHSSKRQKVELDIDDTPAGLPSIDLERDTYIDSHENGYDLSLPSATVATADTTENVFASLDTLVRDSGAHESFFEGEA